jgi:hypothetical protein
MTVAGDPRANELQSLQREYRHMEINRRAYSDESQVPPPPLLLYCYHTSYFCYYHHHHHYSYHYHAF